MEIKGTDYPKFTLGEALTKEQIDFFNETGFIHFTNFIDRPEIDSILNALWDVQDKWIAEDRKKVNGVPIFYGHDHNGKKIVHRFPFTSHYNEPLHDMVSSGRLDILKALIDRDDTRIGENEKDGTVVNQYINTGQSKMRRMAWHIDGTREFFYGQKLLPMLNIGVYFTDSTADMGGLRLIPGSHKGKMMRILFRKKHFLDVRPDKDEIAVDARAGDLTVHNGNVWHRVEVSPLEGEASRRVIMYVPMICGKVKVKHAHSRTPLYHRFRRIAKL